MALRGIVVGSRVGCVVLLLGLRSAIIHTGWPVPCSRSSLRNWDMQVSKNGHDWITIHSHENDTSLGEPG